MKKLLCLAIALTCMQAPSVVLASGYDFTIDSPPYSSLLAFNTSQSAEYLISSAESDLLLFFDEEDLFITATKLPQKISEAPAIASVISGDEMRSMGARNILDVLRRIPGFGITKGYYGKAEIEVRGIKTDNSEKVKILIDGYSVNNVLTGGAIYSFDAMPVDNVKRIEVIRGPGSALYGSNAVSAVINIITKDGRDIDGTIASVSRGSFNTTKTNIQTGTHSDDFDVAFSVDYIATDGAELAVGSDFSTTVFSSPEPAGDTHEPVERLETALKISYKDFALKTRYTTNKRGAYIGVGNAVNDESEVETSQYYVELSYKHDFGEGSLFTKAYLDTWDFEAWWEIYPENGHPDFPNGMIGKPSITNISKGIEAQFDYPLTERNQLMLGAVIENKKSVDSGYLANYDPTSPSWAPLPSGEVENVKSLGNWTEEAERDIWAVYVQDLWQIEENISLTLGVRHDDYSDFGDTTNMRSALVWGFSEKWNLKLLAGQAFRAPSFEELYNINNPVVVGNQDLKPETMTTYEVSINSSYGDAASASLTYFNNRFDEKIQNIDRQFQNTGGAMIWGVEADWKMSFSHQTAAYLNYTYTVTKDEETRKEIQDIPEHRANIGFNARANRYMEFNTNIQLVGSRPRAPTDRRDEMPAYGLVDVTVIGSNFYKSLELRASVHNLFDKEYADPAPQSALIEDDFPREGVSYTLEARYKF
ncbi:MAG: TonB-dependent receptor [Candidatus Polarisedimenticolaceae bacterium]|nr:TonB-dependent receptor [Candidatus Polarisedimenticolaceae bacterium]